MFAEGTGDAENAEKSGVNAGNEGQHGGKKHEGVAPGADQPVGDRRYRGVRIVQQVAGRRIVQDHVGEPEIEQDDDAEGEKNSPFDRFVRIFDVRGGVGDDAVAGIGKKGDADAAEKVRRPGAEVDRRQFHFRAGEGDDDQNQQDRHFDADDQRFRTADVGSLQHIQKSERYDQQGGKRVDPERGRGDMVEQFGGINAESLGHHRD